MRDDGPVGYDLRLDLYQALFSFRLRVDNAAFPAQMNLIGSFTPYISNLDIFYQTTRQKEEMKLQEVSPADML